MLQPLHSRFPDSDPIIHSHSFESFMSFDEDIFEVLLPFKEAWRDGLLDTPWKFTSPSLFERAFSELFFCYDMYVITEGDQQLSQPFTSLPAVRECTSLEINDPPSAITVTELVEWLNADARSKEPKQLEISHYELNDTVENLVERLKTVSLGGASGERRAGGGRQFMRTLHKPPLNNDFDFWIWHLFGCAQRSS